LNQKEESPGGKENERKKGGSDRARAGNVRKTALTGIARKRNLADFWEKVPESTMLGSGRGESNEVLITGGMETYKPKTSNRKRGRPNFTLAQQKEKGAWT